MSLIVHPANAAQPIGPAAMPRYRPTVLMPIMVNTCFDVIKQLNDEGITVLVVEQNANKALKIADRGYVLETGNIIISDTAENMRKDDTVQKAYLGG